MRLANPVDLLCPTPEPERRAPGVDYLDDAAEIVRVLRARFSVPVALPTPQQLKTWLFASVPPTILHQLLLAGTFKNCSGISPWWAEVSAWYGYPVIKQTGPGHVWNVALTTVGPVLVDLSAVQFEGCRPGDPEDPYEWYSVSAGRVLANPFLAIDVAWRKQIGNRSLPTAVRDNLWDPLKSYEYAKNHPDRLLRLPVSQARAGGTIDDYCSKIDASVLNVLDR